MSLRSLWAMFCFQRRVTMTDTAPQQEDIAAEETLLHPRESRYEDLETAKEYPHRFFVRPPDYTTQVMWEEPDDRGHMMLCGPEPHRLRSDHSKHPCYMRFKNNTPHRVRMLWVDYNGNEIAYEFVEPNATVIQQTFTTHPWVVREVATCTQLLLNGCEAFIASETMLDEARRAAAAAGDGADAQQQNDQQIGVAAMQPQQQLNGQAGQQAGQQQQLQQGIPIVQVEVRELPQLMWTKEVHTCFPSSFKANIRAFLLCHQKLQQAIAHGAAYDMHEDRTHLGHVPTLLLPHITAMSAPVTPQGIHFPAAARTDIKPTLLPEPPTRSDDQSEPDTAPAGVAEEPAGVADMELW